jgi:hypothetical protein
VEVGRGGRGRPGRDVRLPDPAHERSAEDGQDFRVESFDEEGEGFGGRGEGAEGVEVGEEVGLRLGFVGAELRGEVAEEGAAVVEGVAVAAAGAVGTVGVDVEVVGSSEGGEGGSGEESRSAVAEDGDRASSFGPGLAPADDGVESAFRAVFGLHRLDLPRAGEEGSRSQFARVPRWGAAGVAILADAGAVGDQEGRGEGGFQIRLGTAGGTGATLVLDSHWN